MNLQAAGNDPAEQAAEDVTRLLARADGLRRLVEVARREGAHPHAGGDRDDGLELLKSAQ
jgi:hypothetical protein